MSIIYDALKKTQKIREKTQDQVAANVLIKERGTKHRSRKMVAAVKAVNLKKPILFLGFISLITMILFGILSYIQSGRQISLSQIQMPQALHAFISKLPRHTEIIESRYLGKHTLNGVFLSDNETVAMINKKMFHLGDTVDGMSVAVIGTDGVEMRHENQTIFLRADT